MKLVANREMDSVISIWIGLSIEVYWIPYDD